MAAIPLLTTKDRAVIEENGYRYNNSKRNAGGEHARKCERYRQHECRATVFTAERDENAPIVRRLNNHTCERQRWRSEKLKLHSAIKHRAATTTSVIFQNIFHANYSRIPSRTSVQFEFRSPRLLEVHSVAKS